MRLTDIQKATAMIDPNRSRFSPEEQRQILKILQVELHQFYQELEMSSRYVEIYQMDDSVVPERLHSHSFHEMIFCHKACCVEYLVEARRYRLQRGDVIYIPPGVSHCRITSQMTAENCGCYVVWFSKELTEHLNKIYPHIPTADERCATVLHPSEEQSKVFEALLQKGVLESKVQDPVWEYEVLGYSMQLLGLMKRLAMETGAIHLPAEKPELLENILSYIEENLSRKITVPEIARTFYVSESTVTHIFRKKLGVSFTRCVTQRRLIEAKSLIEKGCSLEQAAIQAGFSDYSYFYRSFRQEYGISPREYRRKYEQANIFGL